MLTIIHSINSSAITHKKTYLHNINYAVCFYFLQQKIESNTIIIVTLNSANIRTKKKRDDYSDQKHCKQTKIRTITGTHT